MNEQFWKQFPPIPGFNSLETKWRAEERIYEETKGMSAEQRVAWFRNRAFERAARKTHRVAEEPPTYGGDGSPDAGKA